MFNVIGIIIICLIVGKVIYNCEKEDKLNVTKEHYKYKGLF